MLIGPIDNKEYKIMIDQNINLNGLRSLKGEKRFSKDFMTKYLSTLLKKEREKKKILERSQISNDSVYDAW